MPEELFLTIRHNALPWGIHHVDGSSVTIGRTRDCTLCLPDPAVSRQHAAIDLTPNGFLLHDLGSRNGTQLNGQPIVTAGLTATTVVQIGPFTLRVFDDRMAAEADFATADDSTGNLPLSLVNEQERLIREQQLTPAQRRVYDHMLRGLSEKEVAAQLRISIHTVHSHSRAIYQRFGVSSRAELISWCGGLMEG